MGTTRLWKVAHVSDQVTITKPTRLREEYKIRESHTALLPCYSLRINKAGKLPLIIKLYIFIKVITKNEEILTGLM